MKIAVVGKYTNLLDSYKSLAEALAHGGIANSVRVQLDWVDSEIFEQPNTVEQLEGVHGILVPGGFGERGTEGKIEAVRFARERGALLRHLLRHADGGDRARAISPGCRGASSTEFGPCQDPVVGLLTEWARGNEIERRAEGGDLGGTMRLGAYPAVLAPGSLVATSMPAPREIAERHRHRYEVNVRYSERLEGAGMRFSGMSPDGVLPEIVEYPGPSVVHRRAVPPRVEVEAVRAAPAVPRLHRRGGAPDAAGVGRPPDQRPPLPVVPFPGRVTAVNPTRGSALAKAVIW